MRRRLVPTLTLSNLLLGFAAIYMALLGDIRLAALMVLLGGVLDVLDGFLARRWNLGSEFGVQLDSLADVVTFGVAPACVVGVAVGLQAWGAWAMAGLYLAAVAWRLARYTVRHEVGDARKMEPPRFSGMPSPAGAGVVLAPLLDPMPDAWRMVLLPVLCLAAGLLMVSTLPYYHTRYYVRQALQGPWLQRALALALTGLWLWFPYRWSLLFGGYLLSGPVNALFRQPRAG